jgi:hypothetical protein
VRFTNEFGTVEFVDGEIRGDERLVAYIRMVIDLGVPCGCDFWGSIEPSLDSEWRAYLAICGAIKYITGVEPSVDEVPDNPDGYEPEGPVIEQTTTVASGHFIVVED